MSTLQWAIVGLAIALAGLIGTVHLMLRSTPVDRDVDPLKAEWDVAVIEQATRPAQLGDV